MQHIRASSINASGVLSPMIAGNIIPTIKANQLAFSLLKGLFNMDNPLYISKYQKYNREYVYFILQFPYVKIGRTNDLHKRIATFQTAHSRTVYLLGYIKTKDSVKCERYLHSRFAYARCRGEFFMLRPMLVIYMLKLWVSKILICSA